MIRRPEARAAGDHLVETALPALDGGAGRYWQVAAPSPGGRVTPFLGLLHGAAGMGLAVAQLAAASDEERYLDGAVGAAEFLLTQAHASGDGGLSWPRYLGDTTPGLQAHCHGADGIGQFFLRLHRLTPDPRYRAAGGGGRPHGVYASDGKGTISPDLMLGYGGVGSFLLRLADPETAPEPILGRATACRDSSPTNASRVQRAERRYSAALPPRATT